MKKREQATLVASLFSKWLRYKEEEDRFRELNKLSFEMSLWMPDDVALEINKRLQYAKDAKQLQDLIIDVRKIIQGADTKLRPGDITFFGV